MLALAAGFSGVGVVDIGAVDGFADLVEAGLEVVEVVVEVVLHDFIDGVEVEVGKESPGDEFGLVGINPIGDAGYAAEGCVDATDAELDRPGKHVREDEEFDDFLRLHMGDVNLVIVVVGAAGAEDCHPLEIVGVLCGVDFFPALHHEVFDVEEAGGHVGALEIFGDLHEIPTLSVGDGGVGKPLESVGVVAHALVKFKGAFLPVFAGFGGFEVEVEAVDLLPHFRGNLVTHHAGVFAATADATDDGAGVFFIKGEEFRDGVAACFLVMLVECGVAAGGADDRFPVFAEAGAVDFFVIEKELEIDVNDAGNVFRPLNVAAHPV